VLTGLRKGELASITVGQLDLDSDPAYLILEAADEKNREGSTIPLRADLAADLRQWLADKQRICWKPKEALRPCGLTRNTRTRETQPKQFYGS